VVTIASPSAILAASKAVPGGAARTLSPQQAQGPYIGRVSPLVEQLNNERGYSNLYGGFLPRPPSTFTDGAFSPFSPIMPVPIDAPQPGFERPEPRRFQYRTGYNLPIGEPGSEEGYRLAPFSTLKSLAKSYSIARRCIQLVKKEVCGLQWDITLTSHAEKAYQGDRVAQRDFGERRAKAMKFFGKPDPNYFNFTNWLSAMMEQILVIDALSLYVCPKKGTGLHQGLLGSDLDSLWCVDGETIRPLLNLRGGMPLPPAPAYQQYEFGVPRADFMTMMAGLDLVGLEGFEAEPYRGDQLMYLPMVPFADSPYGFGPTEQALIPIMTGLRKQGYQLEFFTEGTVPAVYISPGESMTPNQIRELQDSLNAVANDQAFHWKVIVLPQGTKTSPMKPNDIVDQSDEWIANEVCMMYGVSPMDVGILPKVSTVASPFAAREMAQASRTGKEKTDLQPMLMFLAAIPNFILQQVCDQPDMEFAFEGMREIQDEAALTDTYVKQAQIGVRSVDEFRDKIGLPPWGIRESSGPVVFTPMGPIPLADAVAIASSQAQAKALPPGQSGKKPAAASAKPLPSGTVPGRQRARGGASLTAAHAASEGFMQERAPKKPSAGPAHPQASVKAALAELEALTRHLRKGREITTWEPRNLPPRALSLIAEQMARGLDAEQAAGLVKTIVLPPASYQWVEKAEQAEPGQAQQQVLIDRYEREIEAAFASAAVVIAKLIAAWGAGTLAVTTAVLAGMIAAEVRKALEPVLAALWAAAWTAGEDDAGGGAGGALEAFLATMGRQVQEWVQDTNVAAIIAELQNLAGMKRKARVAAILALLLAGGRAGAIAITEVIRAWWAAVLAVWKMLGVTYKGWQTRDDSRVCAACRKNQAQGFIPAGARFQSGDEAPLAHIRCRCRLIQPPPGWTPPAAPANKKRKRGVNLDGEVVIADAGPDDPNPAGGGGRTLYPHRPDGTEMPGGVPGASAGGEPPRWDASTPERRGFVNQYGEDDADFPKQPRAVPPRADEDFPDGGDEDGESWPEGGHGTEQAPVTSIGGGPRGRAPNGVGKAADAAARFLKGAPKAKTSAVRKLMSENFPPDALEWVGRAKWVGPVEIPLDLLDMSGRKGWAASHQRGHVNAIAADLKAGKPVNAIIGVIRPGHNHIRLVDGRHRTLAAEKAGQPVHGYVGFLDRDSDLEAAYDSYHQQFHSGADPKNE
jgi:Phage portal protein